MLDTCQPRHGRSFVLGLRGASLLAAVAMLSHGAMTAHAVNDGPQAYYFNAVGVSTQGTANGAWWQFAPGATISGVFIVDNRLNPTITVPVPDAGYVDVTNTTTTSSPSYGGNYPSQWQGFDSRYLMPSQSAYLVDTTVPADGIADTTVFERGLSGFNYVNSNGYTFRRRASPLTSQASPLQVKALNDYPYTADTKVDAYQVIDNIKLEATGDGRNGATIELTFIEANFGANSAVSLSNTNVLPSLDLNDFQPAASWGILADGIIWQIEIPPAPAPVNQNLHAIPFGDTNGSGKVTSGDFAALAANYLKPADTYPIYPGEPTATAEPPASAAAIWTMGDFNVDGLVNHTDYKMFVNPGSVVTGLPRNFLDGDVNFDGIVNIFDVNAVSFNWGGTTSPAGDANLDAAINIFDVNAISSNWNAMGFGPGGAAEGSGTTAVPEPGSLLLLALAGAGFACVARRRRVSLLVLRQCII